MSTLLQLCSNQLEKLMKVKKSGFTFKSERDESSIIFPNLIYFSIKNTYGSLRCFDVDYNVRDFKRENPQKEIYFPRLYLKNEEIPEKFTGSNILEILNRKSFICVITDNDRKEVNVFKYMFETDERFHNETIFNSFTTPNKIIIKTLDDKFISILNIHFRLEFKIEIVGDGVKSNIKEENN